MVNEEKYLEWLDEGIKAGYISKPFCYTHDGDPYMTEEENDAWEEGGDPCSPVVKLIVETGYAEEVERNVMEYIIKHFPEHLESEIFCNFGEELKIIPKEES
jgi:hypothetical protein